MASNSNSIDRSILAIYLCMSVGRVVFQYNGLMERAKHVCVVGCIALAFLWSIDIVWPGSFIDSYQSNVPLLGLGRWLGATI
jgi:hypothetical protein